jgi:CubicO group peptidase (beta-lactamase class C family)
MEHCVDAVAPAGAVWSTALDIAEYLRLELGGGRANNGEQLLSEKTLQSRWCGGITAKVGYGLGLMHAEERRSGSDQP